MLSPSADSAQVDQTGWFIRFVLVAGVVLLVRLISLWFNNADLFFDEAQYWVWAKEPAFGYFSKPPLLAWVIAAFTGLCGDSEFCVRLPSAIFHTLTAGVLYAAARHMFDSRTGFWTGVTWLLLPAVSLSSTLISTDVPLLLCWAVALYGLLRLQEENRWQWAVLVAIAMGLGLNAKYAMAYFLLCAITYGLFVKEGRWLLASAKFWVGMIAGFAFLVPNILWNRANEFITASHTGDNIGWGGGFPHFDRLGEFFGSQFGVVGPILFGIYLIALWRFWREGATPEQKLLVCFSLPVLLLICFQAVMSRAYANWAATAFPAVVILVSHLLVTVVPPVWNRVSTTIHAVVFATIAVATAFAAPGQLPLPEKQNPFARMWGGAELAEGVKAELANGDYTYVLSDSRKRSATLIYYLRDTPVRVLALRENTHPEDHFELTRALQDQAEETLQDAVFLFPYHSANLPEQLVALFEEITQVGRFSRHSATDKTVTLFRLEGYRG